MNQPFKIIDISQPIAADTACFPGDVPFSRQITVSYETSQVMNLSAFTMSPHVGTHADAPCHVQGTMMSNVDAFGTGVVASGMAGVMPLSPFIGPVTVLDVSPATTPITWEQIAPQLECFLKDGGQRPAFPQRLLFKTCEQNRFDRFEGPYASFTPGLVEALAERGVILMGLDTPSVDDVESKTLDAHHALLKGGLHWLENLDLSNVPVKPEVPYSTFLVALPLKFMSLEASPVRAVLLNW